MSFNQNYKLWHKPKRNNYTETGTIKKGETHQGYYKVKNTSKYVGDPNLVIYRSSWEFSFCKWADHSDSILRWSSEPVKVKYYDRVSKLDECRKSGLDPNNPSNWTVKNYNTDFWVEVKKSETEIERWFIEIKPKNKLIRPKPVPSTAPLKDQKRFVRESKEYLINEAKFAAMKEWSERNGAKFYVFTEEHLHKFGIIGGRFDLDQDK